MLAGRLSSGCPAEISATSSRMWLFLLHLKCRRKGSQRPLNYLPRCATIKANCDSRCRDSLHPCLGLDLKQPLTVLSALRLLWRRCIRWVPRSRPIDWQRGLPTSLRRVPRVGQRHTKVSKNSTRPRSSIVHGGTGDEADVLDAGFDIARRTLSKLILEGGPSNFSDWDELVIAGGAE